MPSKDLDNSHSDYIYDIKHLINFLKWVLIGISQPNLKSRKILINRTLMKVFPSNFTDELTTKHYRKKCKTTSVGVVRGHVTYFYNFGTPSSLARRLTTRGSHDKNEN